MLLAAAGDGKSTALMQVAYRMHKAGRNVYWRPHAGVTLDVSAIADLATEEAPLLIVDEADNCVPALEELAGALEGRQLDVVAGARLSDWRNARGDISRFANVTASEETFGRLSRREGRAIIAAWSSIPKGLGLLGDKGGLDEQLKRLLDAVESDKRSNGSLLGGLFRLRFDQSRLDAHVNEMLDNLEEHTIDGSHVSLLKAFIYVCAFEIGGLAGIDRRLWAELLGIDVKELRRTVEFSLGTEAATARAGGLVQVRHPEIARSAIRLLRGRSRGLDLGEIYGDIVRSAIALGRHLELADYSRVVHLPTKISDGLREAGYSKISSYQIAVNAASEAAEAEPSLLVYETDLGSLYRKMGQPEVAAERYAAAYTRMHLYRDRERSASGFFYDWSLSYLDADEPASALLVAAVGLSRERAKLTRTEAGRYFVVIARSLVRIGRDTGSERARLGLAAVFKLAESTLVPADDLEACRNLSSQGKAPSTSQLDSSLALRLLEKCLVQLTREAAALQTLRVPNPGLLSATIEPLIGQGR
ncbi:hypothetical protein G5V58_19210 [Nocardioides anomalus]|uniref:Novel STAND NTPase 5 domain-containing protein n=1 Tax=Nocardioides anomalus TaxID=2712223 RepID=A0A6G6WHE0_9ACTN|nr:hypothetical protein [Nocardioides anomalus]QIG44629.1 hypothetical protein G5V58_19210 [Nocardioides anomalus]